MEANTDEFPWRSLYKIMIGSILPRPIGWVSTVDVNGESNLAPFSFFNAVCANPPTVLFCPGIRSTDQNPKDTLNNIRNTGEFVLNIVTEMLGEAMNLTATELSPGVDEFEYAGLTTEPSVAVKPLRVAESPIHFECKLTQIVDISDEIGGASIVIGRIVHFHVDDRVLIDGDKINLEELKPIGRLAGSSYSRVNDIFDMVRRPSQVKSNGR
jgi:flavin reductase (DIM6/NTAB) family NADH-FMN oxidoreductase RutF